MFHPVPSDLAASCIEIHFSITFLCLNLDAYYKKNLPLKFDFEHNQKSIVLYFLTQEKISQTTVWSQAKMISLFLCTFT